MQKFVQIIFSLENQLIATPIPRSFSRDTIGKLK